MIGMSAEEYRQAQADAMTEAQLQAAILGTKRAPGLADSLGWRGYHTHRSDRSPAGFPDLVLTRRGRLVFSELKRQRKSAKPSADQEAWLADLDLVSDVAGPHPLERTPAGRIPIVGVYLWRPLDLLDGTIERILRVSQ